MQIDDILGSLRHDGKDHDDEYRCRCDFAKAATLQDLSPRALCSTQPVVGVELDRWPDCPSNSGAAQGVNLIPVSVSGQGVQVGGRVEQKEEKEELETPRSDMV